MFALFTKYTTCRFDRCKLPKRILSSVMFNVCLDQNIVFPQLLVLLGSETNVTVTVIVTGADSHHRTSSCHNSDVSNEG
jgi:hypothetical protein